MAMWNKLSAPKLEDMLDVLNGAQIGRVNLIGGADVDSKTFIVDTSGTPRTVTFTPTKSVPWTIQEIVTAINGGHAELAGVAHVKRSPPGMHSAAWISIKRDGGATVKSTGTANALLGFSDSADTVQAVKVDTVVKRIDRDQGSQGSWTAVVYE